MQIPAQRTFYKLKKIDQAQWTKYKGYSKIMGSYALPAYEVIF